MSEVNIPFIGFDAPNTTPVPDIVFDVLLEKLTGNELKVLLYIIRRTYGFGKSADAISLSQFREGISTRDGKVLDKGCGIKHNRTILVALRSLEEHGYIISIKRITKDRDADVTVYRLHFRESSSQVIAEEGVVTSSNYGSLPEVTRGRHSKSRRVVTPGNQQEREVQETGKQQTVIQERKNALTRSNLFSSEQNRIDAYFLECCTRVPQVSDALKGYWAKLAPRIASQEEMNSLYEYTKKKCAGKADPRVYPGNLVEWVEAWEQDRNTENVWSIPTREEDITEPDTTLIYDQPASHWTEERILQQRPNRRKVIRSRLQELTEMAAI
jgi:Bacteriophage replication protein O